MPPAFRHESAPRGNPGCDWASFGRTMRFRRRRGGDESHIRLLVVALALLVPLLALQQRLQLLLVVRKILQILVRNLGEVGSSRNLRRSSFEQHRSSLLENFLLQLRMLERSFAVYHRAVRKPEHLASCRRCRKERYQLQKLPRLAFDLLRSTGYDTFLAREHHVPSDLFRLGTLGSARRCPLRPFLY